MPASARTFYALFLCSLFLLGHAPGWLHVVTYHCCDTSLAEKVQCCSDCQSYRANSKARTKQEENHNNESVPQHDSDSCAACQSLFAPCGFVDGVMRRCICIAECLDFDVELQPFYLTIGICLPPLRGPPKAKCRPQNGLFAGIATPFIAS